MIGGRIIRLVLYGIALFFAVAGFAFVEGSQYGMGTRIGAIGMICGAIVLLPITRRLILNKFGISIGFILAIGIFLITFLGFAILSGTASDVEITDIQTNVSEGQIETQATLTNPQSQRVPVDINTTLVIQPENGTTQKVSKQTRLSIEGNVTKTYTILNIHKTSRSGSQVDVEFRDANGNVIRETTLNQSHWSAVQNEKYSITVDISNGENATYTPTNTNENAIRRTNISTVTE